MKSTDAVPVSDSNALGNTLREYRQRAGLSQQALSARLGVTRNSVVNWESGRSRPDYGCIPLLCSVLKLPLHRLFAMEPDGGLTGQEDRLLRQFRRLTPPGQRVVDRMIRALIDEEQAARQDRLRETVALFEIRPGTVAAGAGAEVTDPVPAYTFLRRSSINAAADGIARVSGDSMEPVYHDGDDVYYVRTGSAVPGTDVIVDTDDGAVIKRVAPDRTLFSVNAHRPYGRKTEDNTLVVRGRVLGTVSSADRLSGEELALAEELFDAEIQAFRRAHRLNAWD